MALYIFSNLTIGKSIENRLILTNNVTKFLLVMFSLLLENESVETAMFQSIFGIRRISSVVTSNSPLAEN